MRLSIATGNTGGVYYPYGGGLAKIIGESLRVQATAEVTAASVDNLKLIQQRKVDVAFALADTLDDGGCAGADRFSATGAVKRARAGRALPELHPRRDDRGNAGSSGSRICAAASSRPVPRAAGPK